MKTRIRNLREKLLSDNWYILKKWTFDYQMNDGNWSEQSREVYDRGNGATILLINRGNKKVILTRQFRIPTYLNGNSDGMLIETCAGLLDGDSPEECVRRESEEETGFTVQNVRKLFEAYMSPGAVTEIVHFFVGDYDHSSKEGPGGGLHTEQEEIEVLEISFDEAKSWLQDGTIKDGKTIMLLQHAILNRLI
jgi:GDP-mannose pyrophosphatase NudK